MVPELDKLNPKRRAFVLAYFEAGAEANATEIYQRIYRASYRTANVNAAKLLVETSILDALAALRAASPSLAQARARDERRVRQALLGHEERRQILATLARDPKLEARARVAALKLDAELCGELVKKVEGKVTHQEAPPLPQALDAVQAARHRAASLGLKILP